MQPSPLSCFKIPLSPQKESLYLLAGTSLPSLSAANQLPASRALLRSLPISGVVRALRGLLGLDSSTEHPVFQVLGLVPILPRAQQVRRTEVPCCVYGSSWFHPRHGHGPPAQLRPGNCPKKNHPEGPVSLTVIVWAWGQCGHNPSMEAGVPSGERRAGIGLHNRGRGTPALGSTDQTLSLLSPRSADEYTGRHCTFRLSAQENHRAKSSYGQCRTANTFQGK